MFFRSHPVQLYFKLHYQFQLLNKIMASSGHALTLLVGFDLSRIQTNHPECAYLGYKGVPSNGPPSLRHSPLHPRNRCLTLLQLQFHILLLTDHVESYRRPCHSLALVGQLLMLLLSFNNRDQVSRHLPTSKTPRVSRYLHLTLGKSRIQRYIGLRVYSCKDAIAAVPCQSPQEGKPPNQPIYQLPKYLTLCKSVGVFCPHGEETDSQRIQSGKRSIEARTGTFMNRYSLSL